MPSPKKRTFSLPEEQSAVEAGIYASGSEVVRAVYAPCKSVTRWSNVGCVKMSRQLSMRCKLIRAGHYLPEMSMMSSEHAMPTEVRKLHDQSIQSSIHRFTPEAQADLLELYD